QVRKVLEEHISFLSQQFEGYLNQTGNGHLIGAKLPEVVVKVASKTVERVTLGVGPLLASLIAHQGLPPDSALHAWKQTFESGHITAWLVEALFAFAPQNIQEKRIRSDEFKSVIAEFEAISGYKPT